MTWQGPTPLDEVVAEIEGLAADEVIALATPYGRAPIERKRTLDDLQALVDELRRRGRVPIVETRHTPAGEIYAISLDRGR